MRLLMTSYEYSKDAVKLLIRLHDMTQEDYSEFFSSNVQALTHLAWQVLNYGPLWTTYGMMSESLNYLLISKCTGTVNHLSLLVERYHQSKHCKASNIRKQQKTANIFNKMNGSKCSKQKAFFIRDTPSCQNIWNCVLKKSAFFPFSN